MDARNPKPVLRGKGRDNAHAVTAKSHDCFQISLNARATAGIRTGNGEDVGWGKHKKPRVKCCVCSCTL